MCFLMLIKKFKNMNVDYNKYILHNFFVDYNVYPTMNAYKIYAVVAMCLEIKKSCNRKHIDIVNSCFDNLTKMFEIVICLN